MILHRWFRSEENNGYVCKQADSDFVHKDACHGCGKFISDTTIFDEFGPVNSLEIHIVLNSLADNKVLVGSNE